MSEWEGRRTVGTGGDEEEPAGVEMVEVEVSYSQAADTLLQYSVRGYFCSNSWKSRELTTGQFLPSMMCF